MKIINYEHSSETTAAPVFPDSSPNDRLLYLDIETTGLAPEHTTLYLIGALWFDDDYIRIRQWLNENGREEREILADFLTFSDAFTHLVHFNGLGFDLPYLKQKALQHSLDFRLDTGFRHTDLFRAIRPYRKLLGTDSLKLAVLADYLGMKREDRHSGKDLIRLYQRYAAKPDRETESILLLHNHDDLTCLPPVSRLLSLKAFFGDISLQTAEMQVEAAEPVKLTESGCTGQQAKPEAPASQTDPVSPNPADLAGYLKIRFTFCDAMPLPARLSLTRDGIYLNAMGREGLLICPIFHTTLKHYFPDYKNYYYLPMEDMAIHKSIAVYTEPGRRKKATRSTCYVRREDDYIPCPDPDTLEQFRKTDTDPALFQTLESLTGHPELLDGYIRQTLRRIHRQL